ncbi:XRE family transcriptional regulator [Aurantiacibacter xanthus]|uniref:XRE family transcriptional regulator n=1 Tax=Aurantiacibacter xanthus TaxID=1784712 RepID=A0A3A1P715_9SPHN|nr:helix-turn-helix transcriptional regulator [Aurantiacibacter xanthus]RIV89593.1 XRE family transcriptional regulator [Aurantiacibacter xanthus]
MLPKPNHVPLIVDSQKMKSARARRALTQEALAHQARVNVRTIQRAERGAPLRHETLADIAAVLGVPPAGLIRPTPVKEAEVVAAEAAQGETSGDVLRRVENAESVIQALERSIMSELSCAANPTPELMPVLRDAIVHIESLMRDPWDQSDPAPLRFDSVIPRLEAIAALNGHLAALEREGLAFYLCTLTVYVRIPYWTDEGLVVRASQSPRYMSAARLHIAEYTAERVRLPYYTRWRLDLCEELSDEIPF